MFVFCTEINRKGWCQWEVCSPIKHETEKNKGCKALVKMEGLEKLILNTGTCGWDDSMSQGDDYINKGSIIANGVNQTLALTGLHQKPYCS